MAESGTTGFTPADLSLVSGFNANSGNALGQRQQEPEARVGFFDAPVHREGASPTRLGFESGGFDLFSDAIQDFDTRVDGNTNETDSGPVPTWLEERGWFRATNNDIDPLNAFLTAEERLASFREGNTPPWSRFDLSSELELRTNESLNTSDVFTRAEKIAGSWRRIQTDHGNALRHLFAEETTPFLDGLTTYEWKADLRHRSTVVSNTRNDLLPSWLRWRWRPDVNVDGFPDLSTLPQAANSLRFDLWQIPGLSTFVDPQVGDDGAPNYGWLTGQRTWLDRNGAPYFSFAQDLEALPGGDQNLDDILDFTQTFLDQQSSRLDLREGEPWFLDLWVERDSGEGPSGLMPMAKRLPHAILHTLTDGDVFGTLPNSVFSNTYFGSVQNPFNLSLPPEVPAGRSAANAHWLKMTSAGSRRTFCPTATMTGSLWRTSPTLVSPIPKWSPRDLLTSRLSTTSTTSPGILAIRRTPMMS